MTDFILASASPRRRELLSLSGFSFDVIPSKADESLNESLSPEETVKALARLKAESVFNEHRDRVVFGCDTVVYLNGEILGKPKDEVHAFAMLKRLSGKTHTVSTGVCIISKDKEICFSDTTEVTFYELSDETIKSYIATNECSDKAGAYGIQGYGSVLVKEIKGDYFSVMGLPVARSARALAQFNIKGRVRV